MSYRQIYCTDHETELRQLEADAAPHELDPEREAADARLALDELPPLRKTIADTGRTITGWPTHIDADELPW